MGSGAARWLVLLAFQCRSIDNEGRIDRASARICAADSVMFFLKVLESSWSFLHHHSIFSAVRLFKLSMLAALVLVRLVRPRLNAPLRTDWFYRFSGICLDLLTLGSLAALEWRTPLVALREGGGRGASLLGSFEATVVALLGWNLYAVRQAPELFPNFPFARATVLVGIRWVTPGWGCSGRSYDPSSDARAARIHGQDASQHPRPRQHRQEPARPKLHRNHRPPADPADVLHSPGILGQNPHALLQAALAQAPWASERLLIVFNGNGRGGGGRRRHPWPPGARWIRQRLSAGCGGWADGPSKRKHSKDFTLSSGASDRRAMTAGTWMRRRRHRRLLEDRDGGGKVSSSLMEPSSLITLLRYPHRRRRRLRTARKG